MFRIISILIGYFIGCFQTAFLVGKMSHHIDIRKHGSGNAGTTNVIRVLGWKAGILTFLGDLLKAIVAVIICRWLWPDSSLLAGVYGGAAVVIGHNWPLFLGFKGGKGIASTVGVLLALDWRLGLIAILTMICIIGITRYVSLGAIVMVSLIPITLLLFYPNENEVFCIGLFLMLSALIRHRSNIYRLVTKTESKLGYQSKNKVEEK
ncbi:MAG: glycerol-3-phosphate 1-O-acyltransferase PlsY [Epulopiscium sp.]|nr:glycerol-3-phosphate 1-O-acyltransferase PlsY [Candidatus Epulonipiscium sp.]